MLVSFSELLLKKLKSWSDLDYSTAMEDENEDQEVVEEEVMKENYETGAEPEEDEESLESSEEDQEDDTVIERNIFQDSGQ